MLGESTSIIFENKALVRLDVFRLRWPLPILVRISLPEPVTLNRFAVAR